jgi:hypothetical protein
MTSALTGPFSSRSLPVRENIIKPQAPVSADVKAGTGAFSWAIASDDDIWSSQG